jgi:putative ABC transport system permease protein
MTPLLTVGLFMLTVVMCVVSATFAIVQVIRIDPAVVFAR